MKHYVVGFVFDYDLNHVLLLKKTHPEWQKGKYNGVGGLVEHDEDAPYAMWRECLEECNLDIAPDGWCHVVDLKCPTCYITFLSTVISLSRMTDSIYKETDEEPVIMALSEVLRNYDNIVQPTGWILLMARDQYVQNTPFIRYMVDET
jgi:8-oxo-dGTP diphosphatase